MVLIEGVAIGCEKNMTLESQVIAACLLGWTNYKRSASLFK